MNASHDQTCRDNSGQYLLPFTLMAGLTADD